MRTLLLASTLLLTADAVAQTKVWADPPKTQVWSDTPPGTQPGSRAEPAQPPPGGGTWSQDVKLPSPPPPREPATVTAPVATFKAGDSVRADLDGLLYPGVVDQVEPGRYFIRFTGAIAPSPQWVDRLKVIGPAAPEEGPPLPAWVKPGVRADVESKGTWYGAKVLEVRGDRARIRYDRYDSSWDEWVGAGRLRASTIRSTVLAQPTGRFVCQVFEENQLKPQGEFVMNADGTYRDVWNQGSGTWRFTARTGVIRFTGVLANGAKATYDPDHRHGMITFDWGSGTKRWCYR